MTESLRLSEPDSYTELWADRARPALVVKLPNNDFEIKGSRLNLRVIGVVIKEVWLSHHVLARRRGRSTLSSLFIGHMWLPSKLERERSSRVVRSEHERLPRFGTEFH